MWTTLTLDRASSDIATLTLQRPDSLNSLTARTLRDLTEAATSLNEDPPKVVRISGAGRAFSAGADFSLLAGRDGDEDLDSEEAAGLGGLMADAVESVESVTVAELRGVVVGGGLVLAAACDLRLAADDTYFSIPEVDIGLPLGWGGAPRMMRELGPALAKELIMTCRPFTADEAFRLGFLNRVVAPDNLGAAVDDLVSTLASKPRYALLKVKEMVAASLENMAPARGRQVDAKALATALTDPEARRVASEYIARQRS